MLKEKDSDINNSILGIIGLGKMGGNFSLQAIDKGIRRALSISGVKGVFILYKSLIGRSGQIPKIIKILPEKE